MKPIMIIAAALFLTACGGNSDPAPQNGTQNDPQTSNPDTTNNNDEGDTGSGSEQVNNDESTNNDSGTTEENTDGNNNTNDNDNTDATGDTETGSGNDSETDTGDTGDTGNTTDSEDSGETGSTDGDDNNTSTNDNSSTEEGDGNDQTDTDITAAECTAPVAGTTIVSKTTPVAVSDNPYYYPAMGPQCVAPGRQFDGTGLQYGDFLLTNNAWNGQQSSWDWSQCITLTAASDGSILPSWTFDWGNEDDLQPGLFEWEVKSYPEVIYGAKSISEYSAPCADTGLPIAVKDMPDISIAYNYRTQLTDARVGDQGDEANNPTPVTGGDRNIALESFFHSSCDIRRGNDSNMELELMVWLEVGNERLPSGSAPQAVFTNAAGQTFDIYTKPGNDQYIAFVAQNIVQADTLDWNEFMDHARDNAATYSIRQQQDSWCLANVIFGSEIWWGEGSVNLDYYQITSQY